MRTIGFVLLLILTTMNAVGVDKKFELPPLRYAANALEPVITAKTIEFHYGKHLQTYITNLNNLIAGTVWEGCSLGDIVKGSEGGLFNNAAQAFNHIFYFDTFSAKPSPLSNGALNKAIVEVWGSVDKFKSEFVAAGVAQFGSGWVWLVADTQGKLSIVKTANAETPLTKGLKPLLTFDVWEHAYYLDYQNRRADHLNALWSIVDWSVVESRY